LRYTIFRWKGLYRGVFFPFSCPFFCDFRFDASPDFPVYSRYGRAQAFFFYSPPLFFQFYHLLVQANHSGVTSSPFALKNVNSKPGFNKWLSLYLDSPPPFIFVITSASALPPRSRNSIDELKTTAFVFLSVPYFSHLTWWMTHLVFLRNSVFAA